MNDDNLMTCILTWHKKAWEVTWISDYETPSLAKGASLGDTVDQATRGIAAIYAGTQSRAGSELQFAIYPFSNGASTIFDLSRDATGFSALPLVENESALHADTLDALVDQARALANHNHVMFRWVIPMSEVAPG